MTPDELRQEAREARRRLVLYAHLVSAEARDWRASASGCAFALEYAAGHPEAGVKVEATRAELRACLTALAELEQKHPAPTRLPEHLATGRLLPATVPRRHVIRVYTKFDLFAPRRGRR